MKGSLGIASLALLICASGASVAYEPRWLQIRHAIASGSDRVPYPTNEGEVELFIADLGVKYGYQNFKLALHQTFQNEQRDDDWADRVEDQINAAAIEHQNDGIAVKGECRSSLCIIDVKAPEGKEEISAAQPFALDLIVRLRNAKIPISSIPNYTDEKPRTDTLYLYSLTPPQPFVDELVARLRDDASQHASR